MAGQRPAEGEQQRQVAEPGHRPSAPAAQGTGTGVCVRTPAGTRSATTASSNAARRPPFGSSMRPAWRAAGRLSEREREVALAVGQGKPNAVIAGELHPRGDVQDRTWSAAAS
ncbi:hypothetical protein GCM10020001_104860 [Nonomuraea salmonea]